MSNKMLEYNIEEIKKNLNNRVGMPYPPNLYVIIPSILTLVGIALLLIYLSRWLIIDTVMFISMLVSGRYIFKIEDIAPVTSSIQFMQLIFAAILLKRAFRYVSYQTEANKNYQTLVENGKVYLGIVNKIEVVGKRREIEYSFRVKGEEINCKYITYSSRHIQLGDTIEILWYNKFLNVPLL